MSMSSVLRDVRLGVIGILPIALAAVPFGLLLGSEAVRRGLSPAEISLMSMIVFAGSAQFLTVSIWSHPAPWAALALAAFLINLRHVLMSASLSPKLKHFRSSQKALVAFLLADEIWALNERRAMIHQITPGFYFGTALGLYVIWLAATIAGTVLGETLPAPETIGFDFVFAALFISLVTGFAKTWRALPVVISSLAASLLFKSVFGGTGFIVAGGLAGMIAAALLPPEQKEAP
jgi:4-azaleucine resistance transporter AzlC